MSDAPGRSLGIGTPPSAADRRNDRADPSKNVMDLVVAAITRQDDLRMVEKEHMRELLRERNVRMEAEAKALHAVLEVRAEYDHQLRDKESERIDAIRAVDAANVARTAEVQLAQAQSLATQVATSAETLRGQVEATRVTTAAALATALAPITKSIEDLRAAQYAQQGERAAKTETRTQDNWSTGLIVTIVAVIFSVLIGLAGIVITLSWP